MSRYLLDTHMWLWMISQPSRLSVVAQEVIARESNELLLSAASTWEISIKYRIGKMPLPQKPSRYLPVMITRTGVQWLNVELDHTTRVAELPDHHRDPFDRLLVAQAQALSIPLLSDDRALRAYDVELIG